MSIRIPIPRQILVALAVFACLLAIAATQAPAAEAPPSSGGGFGSLWQQFQAGGKVMWVLLALSLFGLAMTVERLVRLRRAAIAPTGLADEARALWKEGRHQEILDRCATRPSALARLIAFAVEYRGMAHDQLNEALSGMGAQEIQPHLRRAYPLAVVATLAPLLGLFGTVVGMIQAFQDFRLLGETGDPSVFAGAISLALITTAGGLVVAMPALGLYHLFRYRADHLAEDLAFDVTRLVNDCVMPRAETAAAAEG